MRSRITLEIVVLLALASRCRRSYCCQGISMFSRLAGMAAPHVCTYVLYPSKGAGSNSGLRGGSCVRLHSPDLPGQNVHAGAHHRQELSSRFAAIDPQLLPQPDDVVPRLPLLSRPVLVVLDLAEQLNDLWTQGQVLHCGPRGPAFQR